MKAIVLLSVIFCSDVYGQEASFKGLPALDTRYHVEIGEKAISEIQCIKKLDTIVKARWSEQLNEIPTTDLANLTQTLWEDKESNYTKYNSYEDEWLMKEGSPVEKISQCINHILSDVRVNLIDPNDLSCVMTLIASNRLEESYRRRGFDNLRNSTATVQLPFRKFISFSEVVELMFQNRDPNTWTNLETLVYAHTKGYVLTDADSSRHNYVVSQNCDWINARALREAPTEAARLEEFSSQVRHTVNKQLAGRLMKQWNLDTILPRRKYELWIESRQEMISNLEQEVDGLRNQNKDVQWLCNHATELAKNFTRVQSRILLTGDKSVVHFEASDITSKARTIEAVLEKLNDARHSAIKKIADRQDEGTRCLSSLLHIVENHRRYELASAFIDEEFEYPEIYCENVIDNPGLIRFTFCNCIGSFCVSHDLAALFDEEYSLIKGSDGVYKIVRSGIKSKRKVWHCHSLANSDRN